ncbi:YicC family protein [Tenuifilum thalassicum]|uniref:YicC family protein n=2 Tax=Tenuifilum thalassicum TaxID=2590900 RepID=A0A7D4BLV0_9BACT|nr:YicC family protein [Tenuifilum thalassicum]
MTGFGKAEREYKNKKIVVEVRSLNSKQLDLNTRLPGVYRDLEMEIRNLVSKELQRGKVDLSISVEETAETKAIPINEAVFMAYYNQLNSISKNNDLELNPSTAIPAVLRLPEVVKATKEEIEPDELKVVKETCLDALRALVDFRKQEGAILQNDLLSRVQHILDYLDKVIPFEKQRIENVRNRLAESLKLLSNDIKVDANRFEQEVIYYLEKLDITEEKVRLKQHCNYFTETVALNEPVGRKLGFIAQEMGREINTLGSKANDAEIQRIVVMMKDELEKIKEQVLNIL